MEDSSKYIFYIVLVIQFILSLYIQNTKLEWAILSSLLVTIIISGSLFVNYVNTPETEFNFQIPDAKLLIPIILIIPIVLITVSIAIVINNKGKNINKTNEAKIQTFKSVLLSNILICTGIVIYIINADRITFKFDVKINDIINKIKPWTVYIPYHMLVTGPDYIISKLDPTKKDYIKNKLNPTTPNPTKNTESIISGIFALYVSSIRMMNSSVQIMNQYNKDK